MRLIDEFLPSFHFSNSHSAVIHANPRTIYAAIRSVTLTDSRISRLLFALRGMGWKRSETPAIEAAIRGGFILLGEHINEEIVLGIVGKFWTLDGCLQQISPAAFRSSSALGFAKAAWNFLLVQQPDGNTKVSTETRIQCPDGQSLRRFRLYWIFVGPFSGIIRKEILREIRRRSEESTL
jgi:hypothetical protein